MATFRTVLHQQGNNVGIVVPDEVVAELGAGKRPLVKVTINKTYSFVYTIAVMGGRNMIGFSAAHRAASGFRGGDEVEIALELETAALAADPVAAAAFEKLSFTFRKEHARAISEAKADETRQRRLDKIMAGLRGA